MAIFSSQLSPDAFFVILYKYLSKLAFTVTQRFPSFLRLPAAAGKPSRATEEQGQAYRHHSGPWQNFWRQARSTNKNLRSLSTDAPLKIRVHFKPHWQIFSSPAVRVTLNDLPKSLHFHWHPSCTQTISPHFSLWAFQVQWELRAIPSSFPFPP